MAPKNGMANFVEGRNGDVNPDLADLKVQVPGVEKKQKPKQSTTVRRERSQPGRQSRIQDTANAKSNNSSTENLSTTASTSRHKPSRDHRPETRSYAYGRDGTNGDQRPAMFGGTDYDAESDNDQELPEDPTVNQNNGGVKFTKMLAEARGAQISTTIAQTHIKGDSYPPTSVGDPSVTDRHEQSEARPSVVLQNIPNHAVQRAFSAPGQRPQVQPASVRHMPPTVSRTQGSPPASAHHHQQQHSRPLDPEPTSEFDADAGFTFSRPPNVKKEIAVHKSHPQTQAVKPRPHAAEVRGGAPLPCAEVDEAVLTRPRAVANDYPTPMEKHPTFADPCWKAPEIHNYQQQHGASTGQAPTADQVPASDALTEEDTSEQHGQQEFNEDPLDYGLQELYKKDYASLKAEPFDHQPNAQPFVVSDLQESAGLADKLTHLAGVEPRTQADFFASLNMDEWEEAGDWFLDRFSETIKKLKDVRQEKRKAARALEDEIGAREVSVRKKRALTETAMVEMKRSGAAVLLGTPGKKK